MLARDHNKHIVFDYSDLHVIAEKVPHNIVNRKNWELYHIKDKFESTDNIKVFRNKEYSSFVNLGSIKNYSAIIWKAWNLSQAIIYSPWFKTLSRYKIALKQVDNNIIIQGFAENLLILSRAIHSDYLQSEIEDTVQYMQAKTCDVILLDDIIINDTIIYPISRFNLESIQTTYLLQQRFLAKISLILYSVFIISTAVLYKLPDQKSLILQAKKQTTILQNQINHLQICKKQSLFEQKTAKIVTKIHSLFSANHLIWQNLQSDDMNTYKIDLKIKYIKNYHLYIDTTNKLQAILSTLGKCILSEQPIVIDGYYIYKFNITLTE